MSFNAGEIYYDIGIKDREYARALKRMEQDADRLQKHLDALLEDPEAVIQKRLDALTAGT